MSNKPNKQLILETNQYHLWYTEPQLCKDEVLLKRYRELLTPKEREKQQRYIFEKDRHDALITRAFIRDVLSKYLGMQAESVEFNKGEQGKPEIINPVIPLRFNISHTKHLIACAVTLDNDIGCDVEHIERNSDVLAIADRYFSKLETDELFSLEDSAQRSRFFDYWTLKESYIKAWGQGLAIPLSEFSFHINDSDNVRYNDNISLSFDENRKDESEHWNSRIYYPSDELRVSVSVRSVSGETISNEKFQVRYFKTTPLMEPEELSEFKLG